MKKKGKNIPQLDVFVAAAAGIFAGAAVFEIIPESAKQLGWPTAIVFAAFGCIAWYAVARIANGFSKNAFAFAASLAIWFHSVLEGAITAVGLNIGGAVGIGIVLGMILHLFPEFFAVVAILRSEGFSFKKSVMVDVVTILVLLASFGITYYGLRQISQQALVALEAMSAGAFLYIAGHSLFKRLGAVSFGGAILGLLLMLAIRVFA